MPTPRRTRCSGRSPRPQPGSATHSPPPFDRRPRTPARRGPRFRPGLDVLESREVLASLTWLGTADPGNFDNPSNWWNNDTQSLAALAPAAGDDLYFDGSVSSADCVNMHAAGPTAPPPPGGGGTLSGMSGEDPTPIGGNYNSVNLVNNYAGTVTFTSAIGTANYVQTSGSIAQPTSGTDLTVTSMFNWTGGTLNSSAYSAIVRLIGATATINAGADNTIITGSTLRGRLEIRLVASSSVVVGGRCPGRAGADRRGTCGRSWRRRSTPRCSRGCARSPWTGAGTG